MLLFSFVFSAIANESTPQPLIVSEDVPVFNELQIDSGWLPNSGSLGVRVQISANGTADVDMAGHGNLGWPEENPLTFSGEEDAGRIGLDAELLTTVSIRFDVAGYEWESEIATQSIEFAGEKIFQPFTIGTEQIVETAEEGNDIIEYDTTVLAVVDVSFSGELRPFCSMAFTGTHWNVDGEVVTPDAGATFSPQIGDSTFSRTTAYNADIVTHCDFEFVPVFEVCVPIVGCTDWDLVEMEIDSLDSEISHAFSAQQLSFPLPSLNATDRIDFGEVEIDQLVNAELIIENPGSLLLEGTASLNDDSGAFQLFSPNVYLPPEGQDSIVFAFSEAEVGDYSSTVTIQSNDPAQPEKTITITASVVEEGRGKIVKGCSTSPRIPLSLVCFLPLAIVLRRSDKEREGVRFTKR